MSNTTIRCKLICRHVGEKSTDHDGANPLRHVRFDGVTEQDDAIFGKYTPCADFSAVIQAEVAERLEIGAAYYFDIRQVSAEACPADYACEHAANVEAAAEAPAIPLLDVVVHEQVITKHPGHPDVPRPSNAELVELGIGVCHAIEACGASPELTHAVTLASNLVCYLQKPAG